MIFQPPEHPDYFFDAAAADRAVRFIQAFCRHWEGVFAGEPFILLDWQALFVRTLFGWKHVKPDARGKHLRRFREVYMLTAKGSGKTPLMAAIGMYMFLADDEPGAHVISAATDFPQARLTFDAATKYIAADPHLARLCADSTKQELRGPKFAKWTTVSGTAEGKHGFRPTCLLFDEAHEWPNGLLYNNLTANTTKKAQPITIVCTNAGANRSCFAYQLHERALAVLQGKRAADPALLPVIYETPPKIQWDTEEAARMANPSMGQVITFDRLEAELRKAKESTEGESRYRRLYLSQWESKGGGRWLDMDQFDAACRPFNFSDRAADPCYVGLDMSLGDDLCAAVYVWTTAERFYIAGDFWLPRRKADYYIRRNSIPYNVWGDAGDINLIDEPVISETVQRRIAAQILQRTSKQNIKAVCYDPAYASYTVNELEAGGVTCVTIRQGWSVSAGCNELESRLIANTVQISPNGVMRFCAENTQVEQDNRGNVWPVKPGAKNKYAGKKGAKIDGIMATVTALTQARKFAFVAVKEQPKQWKGMVTT